jgi:hypothetical protein
MNDISPGFPDFSAAKAAALTEISRNDFWAFMPQHSYIYVPTRDFWPASSVNAQVPPVALTDQAGNPIKDKKGNEILIPASAWLDKNQHVEQMTWAPGEPEIIRDRLLLDGGWITKRGVSCFNLYLPPTPLLGGDAAKAGPWVDLIRFVYPDDAQHLQDWFAHRVQRPAEKINHALVLGGGQGIGKDTMLAPLRYAIGPWNFRETNPKQAMERFNPFLKGVILRVSEARDLGTEADRFKFYDHMKAYTASPPEMLVVDDKNIRLHPILNVCGVIITTNHKTDGIYLPADDRRHYVSWSDKTKADFRPRSSPDARDGYWDHMWGWYEKENGYAHVAAFLAQRGLSTFDPKAPPQQTAAFWAIVDSSRAPEEAELADAIDLLSPSARDPNDPNKRIPPDALTLEQLRSAAQQSLQLSSLAEWLADRKNRRTVPHRLESCGYVPVRNPDSPSDGQWKIGGKRQAVYATEALPLSAQIAAARQLASSPGP